jgi:hypothetical protein
MTTAAALTAPVTCFCIQRHLLHVGHGLPSSSSLRFCVAAPGAFAAVSVAATTQLTAHAIKETVRYTKAMAKIGANAAPTRAAMPAMPPPNNPISAEATNVARAKATAFPKATAKQLNRQLNTATSCLCVAERRGADTFASASNPVQRELSDKGLSVEVDHVLSALAHELCWV